MQNQLKGVAVSPGIAIGPVLKLEGAVLVPEGAPVPNEGIEDQKKRFADAVTLAKTQFNALIVAHKGSEKADIFEAHLSIADDSYLLGLVDEKITKNQNAELALTQAVAEISAQFEALDDEYLRERVADFKDVANRLMHVLKGVEMVSLANLATDVVIIAADLAPSDTATMNIDHVLGFATDVGGRTSHTAIMARNMEIPAVVGTHQATASVNNGDLVIVDGSTGLLILCPDKATEFFYRQKQTEFLAHKKELEASRDLPAVTLDGHAVELAANVGSAKETAIAAEKGAEGIGLFRTEFLYMENTHFPTEDEQFVAYRDAAKAMGGKPMIIRTLDIGGDKALSYYQFPNELNPFLGHRAIRFCLDNPAIFKVQLRAILRASAFGKIRIMYPMIISVDEVKGANALLDECKAELRLETIAFDETIETGIMVETPAAVLIADHLAKYVDFFSIGTNDLTQYVLAVDRGNESIQGLYSSYHPAVLRAIQTVIDASHKAGKWTGMCGEFAGEPLAVKLLLGLGLDEFSMSAASIADVKQTIRQTKFADAKQIAQTALALESAAEIEAYLGENL